MRRDKTAFILLIMLIKTFDLTQGKKLTFFITKHCKRSFSL